MSKGLASGVGLEMLSFRVFPFPFINELGSCIALLMLLPLTLLEWPPLLRPLSLFVLLGIVMLFRLVFLLCATEPDFEGPPFDTGRPEPKPKEFGFPVSVGSVGEVKGVELAIVPPTPVLLVGDFKGAAPVDLPVIEQVDGGTAVTGETSAGLCGDGIPIIKGMLLPDALLPLRCGEAGCAIPVVLELVEPALVRRDSGAGIFDPDAEELVCATLLFDKPLTADLVELVILCATVVRDFFGSSFSARSGELRIASAMTSIRGGMGRPVALS
jgi:hypothetical protein